MRHLFRAGAAAMLLATVGWNAAAQQQPQEASPDAVIAVVNGSEISLAELQMAIEGLPPQFRQAPISMLYGALLKQLVERRLAAQAAEKAGMLDNPEVQRRLALARDQMLYQMYLRQIVAPAVTEEKLRERYLATLQDSGEEEVHARHILTETREDAESVLDLLRKGGDFAALAKEHSKGPSGSQGGDLGFFKRGDMVPAFSDAAFALQAGGMSEPVETQFGWHVIKVEERRKAIPPSFEESVQQLQSDIAQEVVLGEMRKLAKGADIKAFNPDGSAREAPRIGEAPEQNGSQ
jgi:peptidyl-prolyl cis-trans isomerase C